MRILPLFQFDSRLVTPNTWKSLVHETWSEMEHCEKRVFDENQLKHKNQARN